MVTKELYSTYILELRYIFVEYMCSSTKNIMNHLVSRCRRITAADIKTKKIFLQEPLDTSQQIDVFFNAIYDGIQYCSEANTQFTPAEVLQMEYLAVSLYGTYTYACKY